VRGPDLVVRAVRDSRKAAAGIHKFLSSRNPLRHESNLASAKPFPR
jgi:hypothetical protein